jgi:hypothetical protein
VYKPHRQSDAVFGNTLFHKNAREAELIERFPDGNVRHTKYLNDPEKWKSIESAVTLAVAKMNMAVEDPEELKRIVFENTVAVNNNASANPLRAAGAATPSVEL